MNEAATQVIDEDGWKSYDEFADGIDSFRLPQSDRSGQHLEFVLDSGETLAVDFLDAQTAQWSAALELLSDSQGKAEYDAVQVRSEAYFLNLKLDGSSLTVAYSTATGRAVLVESLIAETESPGVPRVRQHFQAARLQGVQASGEQPAESRDLIGLRNIYRYSPSHLYEHVYISSERYAWQCLEGVQRGHGDMDLATVWKLAEGLYVFCFREFRIPVASVWLHDLGYQLKTTGIFLGLNGSGEVEHSRGGGDIYPLGSVRYPDAQPI
ncbi:MoaF C-terminal domain-containing protein [Psychromicrobium lacuslunae]|uniref:MoaF protein n=1 Tax=Psychromicrobium lacuslunae TaxID=1618207 RepID=A0A0D4BY92_9MICC|nr:MoaF C-terminal domain-containing protein [Psychromicrobium lacuslunae]AJT41303.1 MoaF protein precursor [Psychromicrobium lacuslunae]